MYFKYTFSGIPLSATGFFHSATYAEYIAYSGLFLFLSFTVHQQMLSSPYKIVPFYVFLQHHYLPLSLVITHILFPYTWVIQIAYCFLSLICALVTFFMTVTKHLARSHFREERFIFVLVLRVQSPARKGMAARARGSLLTSQKAREQRAVLEMWQAINLNIQLHLLPAVGLYLWKVSQPPKTTWPSGDKVFKHINLEELFISRTQYSLSSILQTTSKITLKYKSDYGSVLSKNFSWRSFEFKISAPYHGLWKFVTSCLIISSF